MVEFGDVDFTLQTGELNNWNSETGHHVVENYFAELSYDTRCSGLCCFMAFCPLLNVRFHVLVASLST